MTSTEPLLFQVQDAECAGGSRQEVEEVKIVVNGAGASAVSCTKLYISLGARLENILMLDSKGVITKERTDLNEQKKFFATDRTDVHTLAEAIKGADVFLGLSKGNVLTQDMVRSMASHPIVSHWQTRHPKFRTKTPWHHDRMY